MSSDSFRLCGKSVAMAIVGIAAVLRSQTDTPFTWDLVQFTVQASEIEFMAFHAQGEHFFIFRSENLSPYLRSMSANHPDNERF